MQNVIDPAVGFIEQQREKSTQIYLIGAWPHCMKNFTVIFTVILL